LEIVIAKTAGFCFGVNKAVSTALNLLEDSKSRIFTLGPIIHNDQMVEYLESKGIHEVSGLKELNMPASVVIRAHGVTPKVYDDLNELGIDIVDATCPYVKKIHKLVSEKYDEGYQIIIAGDKNHPEVIGINGWCNNSAIIVDSIQEAEMLEESAQKACIVAQTTLTSSKWNDINEILEKKFKNLEIFDTICNATIMRQNEVAEIAKTVDMMLVIGGKESSNTQKLFEISSIYCPQTYKIEISGDIPPVNIKKIKKLGITAGASTPDWIIKEVIGKMEELNKQENEMSFKEAYEESLVTLNTGDIVTGKIIGYNNAEVYVNLGFKSDGVIPIEEFSDDPDFNPDESLNVGEEVKAFVVRVSDVEGTVQLSKKRVDSMKGWNDIEEAYKNQTPVKALVTNVTNGGVIANSNGVKIFVPASQLSERYVKDLNEYLRKTLNVRILEFNKQRKKIVGSQKVLLKEIREQQANEFWDSVETGKKYTGIVKSFTAFGAFVDIGGVDGLIHISELSWGKIKHPSEVLKIGEEVEVVINDFDKDKKRISLGYRKQENNPWYKLEEKFKAGDVVKGMVVRLVPFGAFVELEKGVDGLVHISQISNTRLARPDDVLSVGQEVEAKIIEVNPEARKISLSIKEVNPIDLAPAVHEAQTDGEEIPTEHKEDMPIKLGDMLNNPETDKKE
jgi:4-hydroxy-3-methylbut-2-enyl diphosphate reductase